MSNRVNESEFAREILEKYIAMQPKESIIGDLHFFDENIMRYEKRPFETVEEMNEFMIQSWNGEADEKDTIFVLGDFFDFTNCTKDQVFDILDRLLGKIVLIAGNHDMPHLDWFREYGITVIEYPILKDGFWILSHEPQYVSRSMPYANIFEHVHTNEMYRDVSPRSFCASAERIGYKPILLKDAQKAVFECDQKSRRPKE